MAARPESAFLYLFMAVVGCCVLIYQAWCRVWKEHYLRVVCSIARTWELPDTMLPYWLRKAPEIPNRAAFRANIDNTIVYLTFALNTALVALVAYQVLALLPYGRAVVVAVLLLAAYLSFLVWVYLLMLNRRDALHA